MLSLKPYWWKSVWLVAIFAATFHPFRVEAEGKVFTRAAMLKAMAQNCIVPGLVELATNADGLSRAAQALMDQPGRKTLKRAEEAWTKLRFSYKRHEMLSYGPVEDQTFWRANFFEQVHPGLTEYTVNGTQAIDQNLIDRVGGSAKGFTAVEYLLFAPRPAQMNKAGLDPTEGTNAFVSWFLQGKSAPRRREYLAAITRDLSQHLRAAAQKAEDPTFPDKFGAGGQESMNLLANQLIVTLEAGLTSPLTIALNPAMAKRAGLSAGKLSGMKVELEGLHRFYRGGGGLGLNAYLRQINPNLDERVEAQFEAVRKALNRLNEPMETMDAAHRPAVEKAFAETRKLEMLLKVDVVSAFGVTIMFNAYDGD